MEKKQTIDWLFVLPDDLIGGGAQQVLFTIINYLINQGKQCTVVFTVRKKHHGWEILENKCSIVYLDHTSVYQGYFGAYKYIKKLSKTNHISYAIASQALINGLLGFMKALTVLKDTKLILRESTSIFLRFKGMKLLMYKTAYKLGYKHADLIICQTSLMKQQLLEALPWLKKNSNVVVIPNPVNLEDIQMKSQEIIPFEHEHYIVAAGRIIPEKGFDLLIEAFNNLEDKSLKLVILGIGPDEEVETLKALISKLQLKNRVVLYGYAKNVYPIFKKAKLCVVSSRIEGFPNVLLQMMSQNDNVVSTLCAGEISNIEGIITCETHNVSALTSAIEKGLMNTVNNRKIYFEKYIKSRSIDNFVTTMLNQID